MPARRSSPKFTQEELDAAHTVLFRVAGVVHSPRIPSWVFDLPGDDAPYAWAFEKVDTGPFTSWKRLQAASEAATRLNERRLRKNPPKPRSGRSRRAEPVITHIIHYVYPAEGGDEERESRHTSLKQANEYFDYLLAEGAYDLHLYNAGIDPYDRERVDTVGRAIRRTEGNVEVDERGNEVRRSRNNPSGPRRDAFGRFVRSRR